MAFPLFIVGPTFSSSPVAFGNPHAGPSGPGLVNLTPRPYRGPPRAVSFAESGAAPIFPSHDALHHRRTAPPGRARAGEAVLRGAGTERGRVRGEGRAGVPGAARSRWGGDRAARVGGCRGQDSRARLHPLLRSGAGSLPFDPPARSHCGSRVIAVGERFAVRVMVTDVWDQVFLAVEIGRASCRERV